MTLKFTEIVQEGIKSRASRYQIVQEGIKSTISASACAESSAVACAATESKSLPNDLRTTCVRRRSFEGCFTLEVGSAKS
jgi:hypothetical protein